MSALKHPVFIVGAIYGVICGVAGCVVGYRLHQRAGRVETKIVEKEVIRWAKSEATAAVTSAAVESKRNVRIVTRWLRPDGTLSRERSSTSQSSAESTAATRSTSSAVASGTDLVSRSATVDARTYQPRLHVAVLLGIDLGARLERRWGVAVSYRIAGPVTAGALALPGLRVVGASVGLTF